MDAIEVVGLIGGMLFFNGAEFTISTDVNTQESPLGQGDVNSSAGMVNTCLNSWRRNVCTSTGES